jgi:deaminated glutathione amidase
MLFLPECFSFLGSKWQETVAAGEPLTGPCISHMAALAREHELWLSLGGFNERPAGEEGESEGKVYNTHLIIDDQGATRAVYRKIHLFDVVRALV